MTDKKHTIAIDFDGTICEHKFPECGEIKQGAKEVIEKLNKKYTIVISSCRTSKMFKDSKDREKIIQDMKDYLHKNKIPYDRIDMGDEGKVVAVAYIDDRAIKFTNWKDVEKQI